MNTLRIIVTVFVGVMTTLLARLSQFLTRNSRK
jgi:hypothetical protein